MTIIPHGSQGQPLVSIDPPAPTLYDGTNLYKFDSFVEYLVWYKERFPSPSAPTEPETEE